MASFYGGINAVSLGTAAGSTLQGASAIAIGYKAGAVSQPASSIVINATGSSLSGVAPNALYIAPIRNLITGTLLMYDTLNKEVVYSSTLNTTFTANNIISLGNLSASTVTFSTVALNTASVSTANVQFLNYSTLSGSTITANTQNVSTVNVQFLNYSTLSGSTITSNVQNVSTVNVQFLNYSTLSGSTISVSVQNVLTTNISTANVQFLNYSSLSGSTISNNVSNVSTANVQFLNYSSLSGSTIRANTQNVSTVNVQFMNYSSLSGSTISNNVSNVSTANVQFINYSSLSGSTITVSVQNVSTANVQFLNYSSLSGSTISNNVSNVSTANVQFLNYSSLSGSTIRANTQNVSTVNVQFMNYSSLSGSTISNNVSNVSTANVQFINYSSLSGSTISTNTANITTLTAAVNNLSTIYAQNILFSTLRGSTLTTNTGFITSTLTVSTIIAANISVSSLALDKFSTLTGSSIIASTVAISTITSNTGFFNSTLTVSTLLANTGLVNSTLTTSTLLGTSILASTVAFSTLTLNTGFITSTLTVSTIIAANISVSSLALDKFSTLTGSSIIASTVAISTLASNTGFFNSTLTVSTLIVSTTNTQFMNYSTLIGSTISSNVAYSNLLLFSSIASVNGSSFGNTGPTGNTGATGPTLWAATGTNGPYNNAITYSQGYVGVGPTGTSYLQTTSGGATAGTSSYVPQYPVDVAGTVRSSAQLFADNSAMVSATPSLDYNTFGKNWTIISQLPATGYNACAMSANGQYQVVAAASPNGIYYSSNYGQTWTRSASLTTVACVSLAMSASGQYAVTNIVGGSNLIYISNNYGQTWTATTQGIVNSTARAAMSANGQYILIASQGATNQLYSSSDYGSTWTRVGASSTWTSVAMSASGQYQLACPLESGKYCNYSFNYGQTWQQSTTGPTSVFAFGMTMSASGQYACLVLSNAFGAYYSSNYGQSWTASSDAINMYNVCMSASGQYAVAVAATGGTNFIYYSINYGINWIKSSYSTASGFWYGCAMSANGQYLLAVNAGTTNVVQSVTRSPSSSIISLGASTNQTYINLAEGNVSTITNWPLTLTSLVNTKIVAMSGSALTQLVISQVSTVSSIYYTSTLGASWSTISNVSGLPTATQTNYSYGAISRNGQYAALGTSNGTMYITSTLTSAIGPSFRTINPITPYIYLPFENSNIDVQGNSIITATGSPGYVSGIVGSNAISLVNQAGLNAAQYIRGTWIPSNNFTISFWFNPQTVSGAVQVIWSAGNSNLQIFIADTSNKLQWFSSAYGINIATTYSLTVNTWYYVVAMYQSNGICSLYVNNVFIGQSTSTSVVSSGTIFGLGTLDNGIGSSFNGWIDDFRIYNYIIPFSITYNNIAISYTGQYMLATVANGGLYMSSNYGSLWTQITSVSLQSAVSKLAISGTGQYMIYFNITNTQSLEFVTPQLSGITSNSWTVNGISWTSSAANSSSNAHRAFNNDENFTYQATNQGYDNPAPQQANGTYATNIIGYGYTYGNWLQIQSSSPVQMYSYTLGFSYNFNCPKRYVIAGSNDGSNWFLIQSVDMNQNPYTGGGGKGSYIIINQAGSQTYTTPSGSATFSCSNSVYSNNSYIVFRFIATTLWQTRAFWMGEWYINFNTERTISYSTNFGATWASSLSGYSPLVAISESGQYTLGVINESSVYVINNYLAGLSTSTYITPVFSPANASNISALDVSQTGQYMVLVTNATSGANVYYSNNYGTNFTGLLIGSSEMTSCAISSDGSYITVSNATTVYQLNNNSSGYSIAIGNQAGQQNQSQNTIAIGNQAGQYNQGQNAIAIGNYSGQNYQFANSIVLNASGDILNTYNSGFYVAPIAEYSYSSLSSFNLLAYGSDNQVIKTSSLIAISSGNIGIGTNNPGYKLDVNGGINSIAELNINTAYPSTNGLLRFASVSGANYIQSGLALTSDSKADLIFSSIYNATEWMRIKSNGNVGIGRSTPEYPLDVYGGTRLMSNVTNTAVGATTNSLNIVRYNAPGTWSSNGGMIMFSNTYASNSSSIIATGGISGYQSTNGSYGGGLQFWYAPGGTLEVGMTLYSNGSIGCGAISSGAISSGAISCTTINTNNNHITVGSGTVSANSLISNGLDTQGGGISCGNITAGRINTASGIYTVSGSVHIMMYQGTQNFVFTLPSDGIWSIILQFPDPGAAITGIFQIYPSHVRALAQVTNVGYMGAVIIVGAREAWFSPNNGQQLPTRHWTINYIATLLTPFV